MRKKGKKTGHPELGDRDVERCSGSALGLEALWPSHQRSHQRKKPRPCKTMAGRCRAILEGWHGSFALFYFGCYGVETSGEKVLHETA